MIKTLKTLLRQDKERYRAPKTAADAIHIKKVYKDGIFLVGKDKYSKCWRMSDINYAVASRADKERLFLEYSALLNSFDTSATTKLSIATRRIDAADFARRILIPYKDDGLDEYRKEYNDMLLDKATGATSMIRELHITVSAVRKNVKDARAYFKRIGGELAGHLSRLGSKCTELDTNERLRVLHGFYHTGDEAAFSFDMADSARKGHSFKDAIAPQSIEVASGHFRIGRRYGRVLYLKDYASYIKDSFLSQLCDTNHTLMCSIDVVPVPTDEAVREVEKRLLGVEKNIADFTRKQTENQNYTAVIPYDLEQQRKESREFLDDLTTRDQRMMFAVLTLVHTADSLEQLDADTEAIMTTARKHLCQMATLRYQQLDGLDTALPIGTRKIDAFRTLTTEALAVLMPFRVQEIADTGGIWGGENAISGNLILYDKATLQNPNGLILGVPGSGKSFSAKREITNAFLITGDDIIISDPEAEYAPLVGALAGQVVRISPSSKDYINPMDINLNYSDDEDPLLLKSDFLISLCEVIAGGRNGLEGDEISIIDRAVKAAYKEYFSIAAAGGEPTPDKTPVLEDLYNALLADSSPKAQRIATSLEIYVHGSLSVFNHRSNVDISNRLVCFDLKELGKQLRKLGMLIVQDHVWNRVTVNRAAKRATRYYMDEMHLLLKEEQTAAYTVEIWKRFRKWGGIPTGITQNVKDLLASREVENIFENSDFVYLLAQAAGDREILAKALGISPDEMKQVTNSQPGEGLILYGGTILPFKDSFPTDSKLYKIMSSKPADMAAR